MIPKFTLTPEAAQVVINWVTASKNHAATVDRAVKAVAETTAGAVVRLVETQNFSGLALSDAWAARKRRKGLDPRMLIATKTYLRSIGVKKIVPGVWGVRCDIDQARRLELGVKGRRGRKHWEPVLLAMKEAAPILFAQEVLKDLAGRS